jgi:hypothetical protein
MDPQLVFLQQQFQSSGGTAAATDEKHPIPAKEANTPTTTLFQMPGNPLGSHILLANNNMVPTVQVCVELDSGNVCIEAKIEKI